MFDTVFGLETKRGLFLKWSLTGGGRYERAVIFDQYQDKHNLNKKSN